ncbi:MAG: hypothetical protein RIC35_14175 [Marinoscillum sp.]
MALVLAGVLSCNPASSVESIQNQIDLNSTNNTEVIEILEAIVEDTGNRQRDMEFLNDVKGLLHFRDSVDLRCDEESKDYDVSPVRLFVGKLKSRYEEIGMFDEHQQSFTLANELIILVEERPSLDNWCHLMLQVSYVETVLMNRYSKSFCVAPVELF